MAALPRWANVTINGLSSTTRNSPDFPFWAYFRHLFRDLLASGFPENSNREIRRRPQVWDRRLILFQRLWAADELASDLSG
jgi:hypothetical protein